MGKDAVGYFQRSKVNPCIFIDGDEVWGAGIFKNILLVAEFAYYRG